MGLSLEVKGAKVQFELSKSEITGYKFCYKAPNSLYAKSGEDERLMEITMDVLRLARHNKDVLDLIRRWSETEYGGPDYYNSVKVTETHRGDLVRAITFPNGYIKRYWEKIDPYTGQGLLTLLMGQRLDKIGAVTIEPINEAFIEEKISDNESEEVKKNDRAFLPVASVNEDTPPGDAINKCVNCKKAKEKGLIVKEGPYCGKNKGLYKGSLLFDENIKVEEKRDFSPSQKTSIKNENWLRNNKAIGTYKSIAEYDSHVKEENKQDISDSIEVLKSDGDERVLVPSQKTKKGKTPPLNECNIDHMFPRSRGGSNSYCNAQVLSRQENITKSTYVEGNKKISDDMFEDKGCPFVNSSCENKHCTSLSSKGVSWRKNSKYHTLKDSKTVGFGKYFTTHQKIEIKEINGLKSDLSGIDLLISKKCIKGVTPDDRECNIDHFYPRTREGSTNSYCNAQVLSRDENIYKSDRIV